MYLENWQFFNLTDGENREYIKDFLESIGIQEQTYQYAFDYYWLNEETLNSLIDWQGYRTSIREDYLKDNRENYLQDENEENDSTNN